MCTDHGMPRVEATRVEPTAHHSVSKAKSAEIEKFERKKTGGARAAGVRHVM